MCAALLTACVLVALSVQPPADPAGQPRIESIEALRKRVELLLKAVAKGETDAYETAGAAVRRLADREAAGGNPAAGRAWCEKWVAALSVYEAHVLSFTHGTGPPVWLWVRDALIEAKIDLASRQGAPPPARVKLYKEWVELLTGREKAAEESFAKGVCTRSDYLSRKAARLRAEAELAALEATIKKGGK
jgi:hypothetical protein